MDCILDVPGTVPGISYLGPARVIGKSAPDGRICVLVTQPGNGNRVFKTYARMATPFPLKLHGGDTVLVAGEEKDTFYIIGILNTETPGPEKTDSLLMQCGVKATVEGPANEEKLQVHSQQGELIFEYDANTGTSRIDILSGNLEINARNGNIDFASAKGIRFHSHDDIQIKTNQAINMTASNEPGTTGSTFSLESSKINMQSPELGVNVRAGDFVIDETRLTGKIIKTTFESARFVTGRLESLSGTVIEKVKNLYRTVDGLHQVRSKRMRTLVDETYHFKSRKAFLKAEEDIKIKGEKIHLG